MIAVSFFVYERAQGQSALLRVRGLNKALVQNAVGGRACRNSGVLLMAGARAVENVRVVEA